ncbi:hypothetical protein [Allokutzneria albata]|uniref:hypothetical protein n=1 Tax=Allokutzneria albata TaxID=211114 RepID=UPI0018D31592|nr:hypothetical protein [Allokutzneria albata]
MALSRYRHVFALPGARSLLLIAPFARIPGAAVSVAVTLHVALTLMEGYGAAGLVIAVIAVGMTLSGPLFGRLGLRLMLAITTVGEAAFWFVAPSLPYVALLGTALLGGFLTLPVGGELRPDAPGPACGVADRRAGDHRGRDTGDIAIIAGLQHHGQAPWAGAVVVVWRLVSLLGGFVYGAMTRAISPLALVGTMGPLTVPIGLATDWWWLCLAIVPAERCAR